MISKTRLSIWTIAQYLIFPTVTLLHYISLWSILFSFSFALMGIYFYYLPFWMHTSIVHILRSNFLNIFCMLLFINMHRFMNISPKYSFYGHLMIKKLLWKIQERIIAFWFTCWSMLCELGKITIKSQVYQFPYHSWFVCFLILIQVTNTYLIVI